MDCLSVTPKTAAETPDDEYCSYREPCGTLEGSLLCHGLKGHAGPHLVDSAWVASLNVEIARLREEKERLQARLTASESTVKRLTVGAGDALAERDEAQKELRAVREQYMQAGEAAAQLHLQTCGERDEARAVAESLWDSAIRDPQSPHYERLPWDPNREG